jgi:EAL domain-containing protein (putative c-di-GMP-specific phosphodiesterase class I)
MASILLPRRLLASNQEAAANAALKLGTRIQQELQQPFNDDGYRTTSSASVGISLFPKIGDTSEILLHEADIAMYQVKEGGRNDVLLFESAMRQQITQRLAMEADLQNAITNGNLTLHVQSQVNHAGEVTGGEALLRWDHPERGLIPPDTFIPLAERSTLILQIGRWVLHEGCKAQVGAHATYPGVPLSVNVSPRQFHHPGFVDDVRDAIASTNANPELLILEVTEGVLIEDIEQTIHRMNELTKIGIRFSIDDFGTGYSSLSYLKRLPLYELKIDRSFIRDTPADPNDSAIVTSIVGVAKHLHLHVVAEGVETQAQVDFLKAIGCEAMQGYFFARPMPLLGWLKRSEPISMVRN